MACAGYASVFVKVCLAINRSALTSNCTSGTELQDPLYPNQIPGGKPDLTAHKSNVVFWGLGHCLYIQLEEFCSNLQHIALMWTQRNRAVFFTGTFVPVRHITSWAQASASALRTYNLQSNLHLIALLLKECHLQREFQCLGAQGKGWFGCFEWSPGSLCVRVFRFSFPFVGSLPPCWCLPADQTSYY